MKTAIITGASSGLGIEFARALKKRYSDIESFWLIARRKDRLTAVAKELGEDRCLILPLDLTENSAFSELDDLLKETKPEILYLINNAGSGKLGDFKDLSAKESRIQIELNCVGLTLMTRLCLPYMKRGSEIINISSIASFAPNTGMAVYSSTKAYVTSFSRSLREELKKQKINVLAVCPGPMDTEFLPLANIKKGVSRTFDTLPRVSPKEIARKSLTASAKGKGVYTFKFFYKFYRFVAKLLPHSWVMKFAKT